MTTTTPTSAGSSIISALGTGSGIDVKNLAANLTAASKAPLQATIDTKKAAVEAKVSSIGKVMTTVSAFHSTLLSLGDPKTFQRSPLSSDNTKVTLTFKDGIAPPNFSGNVSVQNLAVEASALFPPVASTTASLGGATNTLTLTSLTGVETINLGEADSLSSLADRINTLDGYTASIVTGGTSSAPLYYLSIKHGSGTANTFTVGVDSSGTNVPMSGTVDTIQTGLVTPDATKVISGVNANIEIDGVAVSSTTNNFDGVLTGVRITAVAKTTSAVTISSETNTDNLTSALSSLIMGYNELIATIKSETAFDSDATKRGGLMGNPAARQLLTSLRNFTTQPINGYDEKTHTLAELGVKTGLDGALTVDTTVFSNMLTTNPGAVEAILASKRSLSDSTLRLGAVSATAASGKYEIAKAATGEWSIGGGAATLDGLTLTANAGTAAEGISVIIPTDVSSATGAYSSNLFYSKGLMERFTDMLAALKVANSPFKQLETQGNAELTTIAKDQTKLDDRMSAMNARYLAQFIQMDSAVSAMKNTGSSLTNFMDAWTSSLKG